MRCFREVKIRKNNSYSFGECCVFNNSKLSSKFNEQYQSIARNDKEADSLEVKTIESENTSGENIGSEGSSGDDSGRDEEAPLSGFISERQRLQAELDELKRKRQIEASKRMAELYYRTQEAEESSNADTNDLTQNDEWVVVDENVHDPRNTFIPVEAKKGRDTPPSRRSSYAGQLDVEIACFTS